MNFYSGKRSVDDELNEMPEEEETEKMERELEEEEKGKFHDQADNVKR
jgi:hypothetical protein